MARACAARWNLALKSSALPEAGARATSSPRPTSYALPAGRPTGKSTLINTWLGEERLVAFDMPGTTRDAASCLRAQWPEVRATTAMRRKGKVFEAIEKFSVVKTLQAIESANVVLLLLDATQGVTDQDAHIAGYILRAAVPWPSAEQMGCGGRLWPPAARTPIETRLSFLKFAPLHFIP